MLFICDSTRAHDDTLALGTASYEWRHSQGVILLVWQSLGSKARQVVAAVAPQPK